MVMSILSEKFYCGLDLGSSKIKTCVLEIKNLNCIELLAVNETPTRGMQGVSVSDPQLLAEGIVQAVQEVSRKAGVKVKGFHLGIGGDFIEHRSTQARIPLLDKGNKVVSTIDVKKVNHQARLLGIKMDEEVLHDFPQDYILDDQTHHLNPIGLSARKLSVDLLLTMVKTIQMENLIKAIHHTKYDVDNVFYNSYAAAHSSLSDKMKMDGCALIDIGAGFSNVLIFKDGYLKSVFNIPLGGDHASLSIARNLHLSFDQAEDIKKTYGAALNAENALAAAESGKKTKEPAARHSKEEGISAEEVLVKSDSGYVPIQRDVICRILEPEISRLVDSLAQSIKIFPHDQLKEGIVIVGGGSMLSGLLERIESKTKLPVRLGSLYVGGVKLNNAATYSPGVGLSILGFRKNFFHKFSSSINSNWLQNFSNGIKELYQEYF